MGNDGAFEFLVHLARRFRVLEMMRLGLLGENRGRRAKKEKERKESEGPQQSRNRRRARAKS